MLTDGRTDVRVEFSKNVGSYGPYFVHIEQQCFIFVPSFV